MRRTVITLSLSAMLIAFAGCKMLEIVTTAASTTGFISPTAATSINNSAKAAGKAFEKFTPENEYFIGRTIAANILSKYEVYDNPTATRYVNVIGQTVALASDKPETYRGYHVLILDTDEVNAFATPGGFIFISRGLLRSCKTEDAVAAVLSHEVGHVQLEHSMGTIKGSRVTNLGKVALIEGTRNFAGDDLAQAADIFDGTIGDIMTGLLDKGYQASQEYDADAAAVDIMKRVGYNPTALKEMLAELDKTMSHDSGGFGKTHPSAKKRLKEVTPLVEGCGPVKSPAGRTARFKKALANI